MKSFVIALTLFGNVSNTSLPPSTGIKDRQYQAEQAVREEAGKAPCKYIEISQQILYSKQLPRTLKRLEREYPANPFVSHLKRVYVLVSAGK